MTRAFAFAFAVTASVAAQPFAARADDTGYTGKGQLVVQTAIGGAENKVTLGGNIALEERGSLLRIDVLSLAIPGMDQTLGSMLSTQLFPAGGFTVVYDRTSSAYTVWAPSTQKYFSSTANAAPPTQPAVAAAATIGATSDIFSTFSAARALKDDRAFSASITLVGHGTTNGHPSTGLDYALARTDKDGNPFDLHGRLQLADDLNDVPVQITASVKSKSVPESALRLDLTSLARGSPPDGDFKPPAAYARAPDVGSVIGRTLPL